MDREELRRRIEVQQAFLDGEKIQWSRDNSEWNDINEDSFAEFDWFNIYYRIKPEKVKLYVYVCKNGNYTAISEEKVNSMYWQQSIVLFELKYLKTIEVEV